MKSRPEWPHQDREPRLPRSFRSSSSGIHPASRPGNGAPAAAAPYRRRRAPTPGEPSHSKRGTRRRPRTTGTGPDAKRRPDTRLAASSNSATSRLFPIPASPVTAASLALESRAWLSKSSPSVPPIPESRPRNEVCRASCRCAPRPRPRTRTRPPKLYRPRQTLQQVFPTRGVGEHAAGRAHGDVVHQHRAWCGGRLDSRCHVRRCPRRPAPPPHRRAEPRGRSRRLHELTAAATHPVRLAWRQLPQFPGQRQHTVLSRPHVST